MSCEHVIGDMLNGHMGSNMSVAALDVLVQFAGKHVRYLGFRK